MMVCESVWPLNSRLFMVTSLIYVVAHMSNFLTLMSMPRWLTWKTRKGNSSCSLNFFRVSKAFKRNRQRPDELVRRHSKPILERKINQHTSLILKSKRIMIVFSVTFPSVAASTSSDSVTSNCFSVTSTLSVDGNSSFHPLILLLRHKQVSHQQWINLPCTICLLASIRCCELPSPMFSTKIFINTQRSSSPKFICKQFWVLKLTEKFKCIGTSCHHTAVDLQLNIGGNLQGISMFTVVNRMFKRKTYADRLQDTLDVDSRQFAIPRSCQVPGDEHLQVDWLENLNVRLRAILLQCGSKNHSCFAAAKKNS